MATQSWTQGERGYVKERIARSIGEVLSLLYADNLRNDEVDYLYFKIDRIEHILALSSQVVDIECSVFQYVRDAKELKADELDRVSTIMIKDIVRKKS